MKTLTIIAVASLTLLSGCATKQAPKACYPCGKTVCAPVSANSCSR